MFVQSVYQKVMMKLQSQYGLSENHVTNLRSRLEKEAMDKVLIRDHDSAFYMALKKILQKD